MCLCVCQELWAHAVNRGRILLLWRCRAVHDGSWNSIIMVGSCLKTAINQKHSTEWATDSQSQNMLLGSCIYLSLGPVMHWHCSPCCCSVDCLVISDDETQEAEVRQETETRLTKSRHNHMQTNTVPISLRHSISSQLSRC